MIRFNKQSVITEFFYRLDSLFIDYLTTLHVECFRNVLL